MRRPDDLPDELSRETDLRCLVVLASVAAIGYAIDDTLGTSASDVATLVIAPVVLVAAIFWRPPR